MRILALDIGGTVVKSAMFEDGRIVETRRAPSVTTAEACIEKNAAALACTYSNFDAVGVSITGQIDVEKQERIFTYGKKITKEEPGFPCGKILFEHIGKPVFLLNDANAAALGEALYGAGKKYRHMLLLTYGTGVGGGIVLDGKLYGGTRGIAGEVGHMVIHAGSKLVCGCGNRGCYESYASTTALVRNAQKVNPSIQNGQQFFELLPVHKELKPVLLSWVREIVEGLCTLCYIFNPPCIVLGGGVMEQPEVLRLVRKRFHERIIPTFGNVDLIPAELGNQAGLYGAYLYTCERLDINCKL